MMVKLGLQDFNNVSIVPSGKIIISSETMPEYFDKDSLQDVKIDTSYDLTLFSTLIAPALNITKRFAGSEPLCQITRQYNDGMNQTFPQYGIEFVELPRFSIDGNEVSASIVRKFLDTKEYEKIKDLVPKTTYDFLHTKYFSAE
jgi:[citrate (pro-3S)-lyase] ligase